MTARLMMENVQQSSCLNFRKQNLLQFSPAQLEDCDAVITLFEALHAYNASLDPHFALSDDWQTILREQFRSTYDDPDMLWILVKEGNTAVGLLIAAVHTDSPLFRHRRWVEVQALYVADSHRRMGIARSLLDFAYAWAQALHLPRIQLYVTASNLRAQSVYSDEGFATSQAIMRKKL